MARFPVEPLSVTATWLSEVLRADVSEYRLEQIGIGVGLLGRLYRAHLEGGPNVPKSVVVKLPMLDVRVRSEICEKTPDTFRADRNPTGHVAFGSGIHLCLGAQLTRIKGQAVLREIVYNTSRIVTGTPTWTTNPNLRGLTRMDVRLTPRRRAA